MAAHKYVPAIGFRWLAPVYDPLIRLAMREAVFKRQLIENACILPGYQVLDLGCGTATLTLMIKQAHPAAHVFGLDGDDTILNIARRKLAKSEVEVTLDKGMAYDLPYPDASFDRVLSSLVMHHLSPDDKRRSLKEVYRILRPKGEVHIVDFGKPATRWAWGMAAFLGHIESVKENYQGLLPEIMQAAGFLAVQEKSNFSTIFGTLTFFSAVKPD